MDRFRWITLAMGWGFVVVTNAMAQTNPPYEATIKNSSTVVHSAPSRKAYATEVLDKGSTVEVYREDPNGWRAIRPPAGSFSLIRKSDLDLDQSEGLGVVRRDGVKAWVGTRIRRQGEATYQVKLAKGERVEILKTETATGEDGAEDWALIAPPAGEFRWVHESNLALDRGPTNVTFPNAPDLNALPLGQQNMASSDPTERADSSVRSAGVLPASSIEKEEEHVSQAHQPESTAEKTDESMAAEISRAHQILSKLMLGQTDTNSVEFQRILDKLKNAKREEQDAKKIREIQNRFDRFLQLELRQNALERLGNSAPKLLPYTPGQSEKNTAGTVAPESGLATVSANLSYTARGKISRMILSGGRQASGYALQDSNGKIIATVVAAPGVNLERHLRDQVGIQGRKMPHPRWKMPVVYAERVISLERHETP